MSGQVMVVKVAQAGRRESVQIAAATGTKKRANIMFYN